MQSSVPPSLRIGVLSVWIRRTPLRVVMYFVVVFATFGAILVWVGVERRWGLVAVVAAALLLFGIEGAIYIPRALRAQRGGVTGGSDDPAT